MYDSLEVPNISTNSSQFVSRVGSFIGPFWVMPTNPVIRVFAIDSGGGATESKLW